MLAPHYDYAQHLLTTKANRRLNISAMDELNTTRLKHLRELLSRFRNQREFADSCGLVAPHVSQMVNGKRKVGELVARRIERMLGLPVESMDADYPLSGDTSPRSSKVEQAQPFSFVTKSKPAYEDFKVRIESEESIVQELVEELIYVGIDFHNIRPMVSRMTEHGRDSFDFEVMIRPDLFLLGDVVMVSESRRKFEGQIVSQMMSQATRATLSGNKYICVTFGDQNSLPRLSSAIAEMQKLSMIAGHIHVNDVHDERDQIYKSVCAAMNN